MAERNALIETMHGHLLIQEVTNRLLLAELDRLDLDIQYLGELRSRRVIRRWKTYHGRDSRIIHAALPVSWVGPEKSEFSEMPDFGFFRSSCFISI